MSFSMFTMISWHWPAGVPAAGKFVLQTRRREIRSARPTVQNRRVRLQRSRRGAPIHSTSNAAGIRGQWQWQMDRLRSSDALGFDEQQYDAANERERADGGRDKMAGGGFKVHPKKVNRFSRRREGESRVGKHHNAQGD